MPANTVNVSIDAMYLQVYEWCEVSSAILYCPPHHVNIVKSLVSKWCEGSSAILYCPPPNVNIAKVFADVNGFCSTIVAKPHLYRNYCNM